MSRISLRETYDNRSVIAQIAKVTDTAEDAAETVEQKAAEINDAITEVNAAVQAAEGAVTTANAASASAQQSAQTVAGYENRLATAESDIDGLESDLNAVTLRVQTAEGDIVTIQGRVTALETADGQNVKINRINDYAVGLTGNQENIVGNKNFRTSTFLNRNYRTVIESTYNGRGWHKMFRIRQTGNTMIHVVGMSTGSQVPHNVFFEFVNYTDHIMSPVFIELSSDIESMVNVSNFAVVPVTVDGVSYLDYYINFAVSAYSGLHVAVDMKNRNNGAITLSDSQIIYYQNTPENPTELSNVVYGINGKVYSL